MVICKKPSVRDECGNKVNIHCLPPCLLYFLPKNWKGTEYEDKGEKIMRTEDKLYFPGGWESEEKST